MRFKEWCLSTYGICSISESKVIDSVFLAAIPSNNSSLNQELIDFGGSIILQEGATKGVTFTRKHYNNLVLQLKEQFKHRNTEAYDAEDFERHKNNYFYSLGFDATQLEQYRTPPNLHLKFNDSQMQDKFLKGFSSFNPSLSYDVLHQEETVEIGADYLTYLYDAYYQSASAFKPSLLCMIEHSYRLKQLRHQIDRLKSVLNGAQALALDYDNTGKANVVNSEACSAYAMSLKIYAELHRFALSSDDFDSLYITANLLAAYDCFGDLRQSLKTDACFVDYIKNLYYDYLDSIAKDASSNDLPLLTHLPQAIFEEIKSKINQNARDLLYGNLRTAYSTNAYCVTGRFLPDYDGRSDTDELILQGGEMRDHSANFRLIKVGIMANGYEAKPNEIPHHYDYFKVVNNVGANCHAPDSYSKICLGTFVTKILSCICSEELAEPVPYTINPYTDPEGYQALMNQTLEALITNERQLKFYRKPSNSGASGYAQFDSMEGKEWLRLYKINQVLSGVPYYKVLHYMARDVFNPTRKYKCSVITQRAYMQEGGSCSIFSIKSLANSVLKQELVTMHMNFMQQFSASGCLDAINNKITVLGKKIDSLNPMIIRASRFEIERGLKEFKQFLRVECRCPNLSILSSTQKDKGIIVLSTPFLKKCWSEFLKSRSQVKENDSRLVYSNNFFRQPPKNILPKTPNKVESPNLKVMS